MKIAEIYLKQKNHRIDKPYNYLVPDEAEIGQRVAVNFSRGNRILEGIIIGFNQDYKGPELKEINYLIDPESLLSPEQIELALWLKENTFQLFYDSLSNFTAPIRVKKTKGKFNTFQKKPVYLYNLEEVKLVRGKLQKQLIDCLRNGPLTYNQIKDIIPKISKNSINSLVENGIVNVTVIEEKNNPKIVQKEKRVFSKNFLKLSNSDQIINFIKESTSDDPDGQILIVFPNNFLAQNFHDLLTKRGIKSSYFKSSLESEYNFNFYSNVKNNLSKIIIGTYKTLFLNFSNLSKIIIAFSGDEIYFSNFVNHFNIIETAEKLGELQQTPIYFIDFLDSVLSNSKISSGEWNKEKILETPIEFQIDTEFIDTKQNSESIISNNLKNQIISNFKEKKKTLLIMNRRNYYNYYYCSNCHEPLKCPRCGSILKGVKSDKEVECNFCGFHGSFPDECPNCKNKEFDKINFGLDRIIQEVKQLLPRANVVPFFSGEQGNLEKGDVIVATKQILYHPKIENIATIGCVLIDVDLNYPNYWAPEGAYRLYSEIFLRYPDAKLIVQCQYYDINFLNAIKLNSDEFLSEQTEYRKLAKVPPFYDIYVFTLTSDNAKIVNKDVEILQNRLRSKKKDLNILKPFIMRKKGVSIRRFIVKDEKNGSLKNIINQLYKEGEIEALTSKVSIIKNPASIK